MKLTHSFNRLFTAVLLVCFVLVGCASSGTASASALQPSAPQAETAAEKGENPNAGMVMGIYWQQYSGEYTALCYQAFNAGKAYIQSLPGRDKQAAVFDIDETVLDNSPYAAWMAKTGRPWSNEAWEAWCNDAEAWAVPGSLDFANFLTSRGIEVFYISNRPDSVLEKTIVNLKNLGFPQADRDHVFLQKTTSDKKPRIDAITARGYQVVLYAGDSLEDFDSATRRWNNAERKAWAEKDAAIFGTYWIVLPNSVYGTFESALRPDYYILPLDQRAAARLEALKGWTEKGMNN